MPGRRRCRGKAEAAVHHATATTPVYRTPTRPTSRPAGSCGCLLPTVPADVDPGSGSGWSDGDPALLGGIPPAGRDLAAKDGVEAPAHEPESFLEIMEPRLEECLLGGVRAGTRSPAPG